MHIVTGFIHAGISMGLLVGSVGSAIAQAPPVTDPAAATEAAIPATSGAATTVPASEWETYTLENIFAIAVPQGWQVEGTVADRAAVITNYSPDRSADSEPALTDVKTEVSLVAEPPNTFVDREIDALIQSGYTISQYGLATVKGNTAFRVWLVDLPQGYTYQVITFVGYDQEGTAKIVSSYNDPAPPTVDLILQIHRSFELL